MRFVVRFLSRSIIYNKAAPGPILRSLVEFLGVFKLPLPRRIVCVVKP
jgi:hypothetical protein